MITIAAVENDADFQALRGAWDNLLKKVTDENPFLSFEWIYNYQKYIGYGELFVLTAKLNDKICCIAPLCIIRRHFLGVPIRVVSFISTQQADTDRISKFHELLGLDNRLGWSDQADFLYDPDHPEVLRELLRYLQRSDRWDVLDLREISPESLVPGVLKEEYGKKKYWLEILEHTISKMVCLPQGFESFRKSLKRKTKKNIKLYANRLEKLGGVVTRHYQGVDPIVRLFPTLVELERKSRKGAEGIGSLIQTKNRKLHETFAKEWASKGRSHIVTLEREQEVLSYTFLFQGKEVVHVHSTAFNPDYKDCSPGFNSVIESMKVLSAQGFQIFNLGRAEGLIKNSLSNEERPRIWIKLFKKTFLNRLLYFIEFQLRPKLKIVSSRFQAVLRKFRLAKKL